MIPVGYFASLKNTIELGICNGPDRWCTVIMTFVGRVAEALR